MNKDEIRESLQGSWQPTLTGRIPSDSISLDELAGILARIEARFSDTPESIDASLKEGVVRTRNGKYMLRGRYISETEAFI